MSAEGTSGLCERPRDIRWIGALEHRCVELRGLYETWKFGLQHFFGSPEAKGERETSLGIVMGGETGKT